MPVHGIHVAVCWRWCQWLAVLQTHLLVHGPLASPPVLSHTVYSSPSGLLIVFDSHYNIVLQIPDRHFENESTCTLLVFTISHMDEFMCSCSASHILVLRVTNLSVIFESYITGHRHMVVFSRIILGFCLLSRNWNSASCCRSVLLHLPVSHFVNPILE